MKLPVFHKYFSVNILVYIAILEFSFFIPILLSFAFPNLFIFFLGLLFIVFLYTTNFFVVPFFMLLIPIEFYLRKTERIAKENVVNISAKYLKYIYITVILIYIAITILAIIHGQSLTEEELRYD